jgi:hypothetical protein
MEKLLCGRKIICVHKMLKGVQPYKGSVRLVNYFFILLSHKLNVRVMNG